MKYTVVQHSGFVAKGDPLFMHGLESAAVTPAQESKVIAGGGVIFGDYASAEDYADRESFQAGNTGLIPQVPGGFSEDVELGGRPLYVPKDRPAREPLSLALIDADGNVVSRTEIGTVEDLVQLRVNSREAASVLGSLGKPVAL